MNKKDIDWPSIEADYRSGIKTLRVIAADASTEEVKVSEAAIRKHAKACGWERDLGERIALRREAIVRKSEVRKQSAQVTRIDERREIEVAAQNQADLILQHKEDIGRYQVLCDNLLQELSAQAMSECELSKIAELSLMLEEGAAIEPEDIAKRLATFKKLLRLDSRADTFKKLVESKSKLVALERQAFGIRDDEEKKEKSPVNFILNMAGGSTTQIAVVDGKPKGE